MKSQGGRPRWSFGMLAVGLLAVGGVLAAVAWGFRPSERHQWSAIDRAIREGRWEDAVPGLSRWVERHPDDGQARVRLGTGLRMIGRTVEAQDALLRVPEDDPNWLTAQFLLGELAMERSDRAGAERAYRAVVDRQPEAIEPRSRLVSLLFTMRRTEEARALLWDLLRLTGDPRHLVTLTGLALERRQVEQFRDLGGEGDRLLQQLGPFLDASPDDPWLRRARGLIRFEQGDPGGDLADLEFASRTIENDPAVRLAMAESWLTLGEPDRVAEAAGSAPDQATDLARWWLLIGQGAQEQGRVEEAIDAFGEAVAADPQHLAAHYRLGRALARVGRDDEARPILERAEEIRDRTDALKFAINERLAEGVDAGSCLTMGRLCLDAGMKAEALSWFSQAVRLDPFRRDAQTELARLGEIDAEPLTTPRLREQPVEAPPPSAPGLLPTIATGPRFEDEGSRRGLDFQYDSGEQGDFFIADTMGGGVGLIDFDNDGWLDVYFVNGCPLPVDQENPPAPNRLFRNLGDGTFEDMTASAGVGGRGYGMGCAVGDFDGDGFDDLFITGFGATVLYRNNGDGTFEDVTEAAGVFSDRWSTAAGFADLDGDGDLDLIVITYVEADPATAPECRDSVGRPIHCPPGRFPAQFDMLYRNNGDGTFTDVSAEAGLEVPDGRGLGLAVADFDGDGLLDLFVANDAVPDFLFLNRGDLTFEEVGVASGAAFDGAGRATASMGVVADDLDGDGRIDLFHTNFRNEPNTFLRNLGGGLFVDATTGSGLDGPSLAVTGFGTEAIDADNDGKLDLIVSNGHVDDQPWIDQPMAQPPHAYLGRAEGRFALASPEAIGPYFARPVVGRGLAVGDLDNDGRLDLVIVHRDAPASFLRNTTPDAGHWLGLRLIGSASGPLPVGARVSCQVGDRTITRWQTSGTSYLASSDPRLWFGLGASGTIDVLEIAWPSGAVHRFEDLPADQILQIREDDGTITPALPGQAP